MAERIGIIQSRGLGDIVIALPIAGHYKDQGQEVYWPIGESFWPSVKDVVPWVHWIPIPEDQGPFFYEVPSQRLKNFRVDNVVCLYQSLSSHPEFQNRPEFQITGFDQIKYHIAEVPFLNKWRLAEYITRNPQREQALADRLRDGRPYAVLHLTGSDHKAEFDTAAIPEDWQIIEITDQTPCIFDWLGLLEGAEAIVAVDSVVANLVDQLGINRNVDSYFIPRSHIHLTPVLGNPWTVISPGPTVEQRIRIFR
jgi:hypothetical protein